MNLAMISLWALIVAIIVSCTTRINVGILGITLAWIVGVLLGGMSLADLAAGFPAQLFLTLVGVTLLFTQAQVNGTLDRIARKSVRLCRGNLGLIPLVFFALAFVLGSIGPGSIASIALMAPMSLAVAGRAGISPFLMIIMVANGAQASSLSPVAPTGIIVNGLMARMGLTGVEWLNYFNVMIAHTSVAIAGYVLFGGLRLFSRRYEEPPDDGSSGSPGIRLGREHWLTLAVIGALIVSVILMKMNVGMVALTGGLLLAVLRVADEASAIRAMPWGPILMVTGVTVLISLLEKTGGMDLFTSMLAKISTQRSVTGITALLTGSISVYSSTSGVVLPAFLPTVPGLVSKLGGGDALAIASSMNVGAHLVDVSPLSTTGALCLAAAPPGDIHLLFRKLLAWGMSMAVVAAVACYLYFGLLGSR